MNGITNFLKNHCHRSSTPMSITKQILKVHEIKKIDEKVGSYLLSSTLLMCGHPFNSIIASVLSLTLLDRSLVSIGTALSLGVLERSEQPARRQARGDDQRVSLGRLRPRQRRRRARVVRPPHHARLSLACRIHQLWCLRAFFFSCATAPDLSEPLQQVWKR